MKASQPVLILDGHTNQALACVRALGAAGYEVLLASERRSPLGRWSRHCRDSFRLAGQSVEAFAAMREWARSRGVGVVLPLTERSCVLMNAGRAEWEAAGMTVGCAPDDLLAAAFDKSLTVERARACGVSTPPTRVPASLAECVAAGEEVGFPCVVKPRRSNHWDGVRFLPTRGPAYVGSREELESAAESLRQGDDWPLVQGYVSGKGKGVFALCDEGRAVAWFAHERLRDTRPSGSASSLRRSIPLDARLREPAERLLRELKWHGPAMVEFKDDVVTQPCLLEINGRFWGSLQLAIDAGVNFPLLWVSLLEGRPVEPQESYSEGVTLRWIWGDAKRFVRILRGAPPGYPGAYPSVLQGVRELLGPQPQGTRLEVWRRGDLWPGVGEWAGAFEEALLRRKHRRSRRIARANGVQGSPAELPAGSDSLARPMSIEMNSNVVIREARPEEVLGWDELVTRFDNCRVVHKLAWMRSLEACVKGKPLYLVYEKGGEIVGCLPGFLATVGFLRLFGSPLPGWQTLSMGPVFDRRRISTRELVAALLPFLQKRYGVQHVELIGADFDHETMKEMRFQSKPSPSYCARLFPGDEGRVMRSLKESARRNVRRAGKLGLVVRFEDDESFIDEHYDQLREVYTRGGNVIPFSKKRALEFFRHMKAGGNLLAVSV
ncbi:MAG TPA: ATP-grasp domain-containing protein, partial [Pyrinomonadaceae bacterium]